MKRAQTRRTLARALKDAFPSSEEWQRHDHWWGFEYRHADVTGRRWKVSGVWPWLAVVGISAAWVIGCIVGWLVR